jgi:membrane dipeptidase
MTKPFPVFDGHNDLLLRLNRGKGDPMAGFLEGNGAGQLDLPRMTAGGFVGGLFAAFVPSPEGKVSMNDQMSRARYDVPLPPIVPTADAMTTVTAMFALLLRVEAASAGRVRVCRSVADIRAAMAADAVAAVFHVEGAEAIGDDLDALHVLHAGGLRSLGPVWSRPNRFGHGVPFRFPATPDTGPGLTDAGRDLVRECNRLRVMIDLSHINEAGFWEVARLSDAPLVATHSNAHAVCGHARNLTDRQLDAIKERGGVVGLNFATCFIRPDGRVDVDTPLEQMVRHVDHLVAHLGIEGVAIGSDFDGAMIPAGIKDVAGLPNLVGALRAGGYDDDALRRLCVENWLSVLGRTWGG